jgi:hypothetical protein
MHPRCVRWYCGRGWPSHPQRCRTQGWGPSASHRYVTYRMCVHSAYARVDCCCCSLYIFIVVWIRHADRQRVCKQTVQAGRQCPTQTTRLLFVCTNDGAHQLPIRVLSVTLTMQQVTATAWHTHIHHNICICALHICRSCVTGLPSCVKASS